MSWGGGVGSGNLILDGTIEARGMTFSSGWTVQTAANVAGSGAAIVGRPEFYHQVSFRGTDYLVPIYRKA